MKVILLRDVAKIGRRHQVVEVPDGFARNKLIPERAALPATPEAIARLRSASDHEAATKATSLSALRAGLTALGETPIVVWAAGNPQGHLYQALTKEAMAAALQGAGVPAAASDIVLSAPCKAFGECSIEVRRSEVRGQVTLRVEPAM